MQPRELWDLASHWQAGYGSISVYTESLAFREYALGISGHSPTSQVSSDTHAWVVLMWINSTYKTDVYVIPED